MGVKNIFKFCSVSNNFSFAFYCNVFISEKAFICQERLAVFQNVLLLTKSFLEISAKTVFLKYLQNKLSAVLTIANLRHVTSRI